MWLMKKCGIRGGWWKYAGFAVHGCGGAVGLLAAGLATERRFAVPQPYPSYGGVGKQLPIQITFVLFVGAISAVLGYSFLRVLMWSSECVPLS
jgi:ammonia channel protein AmtB